MTPIPQAITTIRGQYDYADCWRYMEKKGQIIYGPKFRLYPEDGEVVAKLLIWALKDPEPALIRNLDLDKGVMLTGPVGCGKTSLMYLLRHVIPPVGRYLVKPCRDIAIEFATDGYPIIGRYSKQSFQPGTVNPVPICFDDLGSEPTVQYFGNPCNTMAEILLSRYDYFISHHMLTLITTNLNSQEIEERYGTRVRSRMRELFNLISFNKDVMDKRR